MFYLIIAIAICCLSGYMFKVGSGSISLLRPNMMTIIFYYYLLLQCVIGAVLIVNNWEYSNWELEAVNNQNVRIYGYWAIMYTMIALPFGMILSNSVWNTKKIGKKFFSYCNSTIAKEHYANPHMVKFLCLLVSVISLAAVAYVIRIIGEIGLFKMFSTTSASELAGFRSETGSNYGGSSIIRGFFALYLCPLMSYVAYGYKVRDKRLFDRFWFYLMFVGSIVILTSNLEKAPILIYLIGFIFFKIYNGYIFNKKSLIIIGCCILAATCAMYILVMKTDLDKLALGIFNRLTISSVGGLYLDFDIFPTNHDFLGISSFNEEVRQFFCEPPQDRAGRIAMIYAQPELVRAGLAGVINCLFIGEAWANWGWLGLILSPIYVGFLIQSFYIVLLNMPKTPLLLGIMVKYSFYSIITGGINDYIYNTGMIYLIIIVSFILLIAQLSSNRFNNAYNNSFTRYPIL